MEILSFDGFVFADYDWHAAISYEQSRGQYGIMTRITERTGNTSIVSPGGISPLRLPVNITLEPNSALELLPAIDQLVGILDPRDQTARRLVASRNGVEVERYARVEIPSGWTPAMAASALQVVFVSEEPEWTATTPEIVQDSASVDPTEIVIENAGAATVYPTYRISWSAEHSATGTVVGQQYLRRMTLTNTQDRVLSPFPYRIDLGDTTPLTTTKAQADGDDVRVIINGEDMTRNLIGFDLVQSYAWIVVPGLDAGEVLTIDIVYGNASATTPATYASISNMDRPVIDLHWETGTATAGSNNGVLVKAAAGWDDDEWLGGTLLMLTGDLAGQSRPITFNNATNITFDDVFPANIDAGDTFLLSMSANDRWTYAVRQTQRDSEIARGRFNIDNAANQPTKVSYDAPASWAPALVRDNRDRFGQYRYSWLLTGVSDRDSFALLDVVRTAEGTEKFTVPEEGTADGMALTTPVPIEGLYWYYQIVNQNGMCKLFVGVRASGAEEWSEALSDDAATSGSSFEDRLFSPTTLDLVTDYDPIYQIVTALLPVDDVGIDETWEGDTGSATSGSTNYTEDLSKEWVTDQYAENGYIAMLSGPNTGRKRQINTNTDVRLNHDAFAHANDDGDRYVVTMKPIRGLLRDGDRLAVDLDDSVLTDSGLGTETDVYDCAMTLWLGAGPDGDPAGQHRVLIGWAAEEKRVFLTGDEVIEIDAATRRIRIYDTIEEEYTAELTEPAAIVQYHDGTQWRRSANWLPLPVGESSIWLEETNIGTLELEVEYTPAYLGL